MTIFRTFILLLLSVLCCYQATAQRLFDLNEIQPDAPNILLLKKKDAAKRFGKHVLEARKFRINPVLQQKGILNEKDQIILHLFSDRSYRAEITSVTTDVNETLVITAKLPDYPLAHAVIVTARNGRSLMTIQVPELSETYTTQIDQASDETHLLRTETGQMASPGCGTPPPVDEPQPVSLSNEMSARTAAATCEAPIYGANPSGTATIRVLIVYSNQAANAAAGSGGIQNLSAAAIANVQTAWNNSNINATVVLAHSAQVNYTETGNTTIDLERLRDPADGYMDEAHQLRKDHLADLVVFVPQTITSGIAGMGYLLAQTTARPDLGFSVVALPYLQTTALAHEMGHNMGLDHDAENSSGPGAIRPYAYGWRWRGTNNQQYRSIMAYSPGTQVLYFSDPTRNYQGAPTGHSESADNARVLREVKHIIAGYKDKIASYVAAPGSLSVQSVSDHGVAVSWGAVAGAVSYRFYFQNTTDSFWTYFTNPIYNTQYSINHSGYFQPGTTYNWRIGAINTCGDVTLSPISTFTTSGTSLPVQLVSFEASKDEGEGITLRWKTSSEVNAQYFGIERSRDGRSFGEFARVATQGDSHEIKSYIHTDETPLRGRSYYRLRQVDHDGTFTYSGIVSVQRAGAHSMDTDALYPNPAKGGKFRIKIAGEAGLRLTDVSGRQIPFTYSRIDGQLIEITPQQYLHPGVYLIVKDGTGYRVVVE